MALKKSWRWFGEKDPVRLSWLAQMGVEGVVTSLHHMPPGEAWRCKDIKQVKTKIQSQGLTWNVVESLPVAEGIKVHSSDYERLIENYILSLKALSENEINTVCYNFMPVLDWARTDMEYKLPNGGMSMKFDYAMFAAFDIYILKRPHAKKDYNDETIIKAKELFQGLSKEQQNNLSYNIIVVTQAFIHGNVTDSPEYKSHFFKRLEEYAEIDKFQLRRNLNCFLDDILPYAEKYGINMAIHPDDPPFSLLGLPRIVSTIEDLNWIFSVNNSKANGLTLCSGSLSVGNEDVCKIAKLFSDKIKFAHLRNNEMTGYRTFYESGHLEGIVDMVELVNILLNEQKLRQKAGLEHDIPIRPDHGISILQDEALHCNPGYPLYGRFKGLCELTGIEKAILDRYQ
ncbi:MAG TPA: mannonate dehydratase [Draconibacterium sp.]|nr:mannonate dehydratase [Draconibacterium sp.]